MHQTLRYYQQAAVCAIDEALTYDGYKKVLYVLPTGSGKTTTFSEITKFCIENGLKVLILAHRWELVEQAWKRVSDHCGLDEYDCCIEQAAERARIGAKVVIGSVMSVVRHNRLTRFNPDIIIIDECHHTSADSYMKVLARWPDAKVIGCTATPMRGDKQSLYARKEDDSFVMLEGKGGKKVVASDEASVFQKLVYTYSIRQAIDDGYLVPVRGYASLTKTDLSDVKTLAGDFAQGELAKRVNNAERTLSVIADWKSLCAARQTIVFCADKAHAEDSAKLWHSAGYTAECVTDDTDGLMRGLIFQRFRMGETQVLTNCGIATEGTDLPTASCVVMLRPTQSIPLFRQMAGRGVRVLPGVVDHLETAAERRSAIAASAKPDCIIIDAVDVAKNKRLCGAASIMDIPFELNLQGESASEAAKLAEDYEELKENILGECPVTYRELEARVGEALTLIESKAATRYDWAATGSGYTLKRTPPGYSAKLTPEFGGGWNLSISYAGQPIFGKQGGGAGDLAVYLDSAAKRVSEVIERREKEQREVERAAAVNTVGQLSPKQINVLKWKGGYSILQINQMNIHDAKREIGRLCAAPKSAFGGGRIQA